MLNPRIGVLTALSTLAVLAALAGLAGQVARAAEIEAYFGQPFGVGRITLPLTGEGSAAPLEDDRLTVAAPDGRVLYPVLRQERPVRRLLRQLLDVDLPRRTTFYFLFVGAEPLEVDAYAPARQSLRVAPVNNPRAHRDLLNQWWSAYGERWKQLRQDPQFPPVVENFLAANLARRLGLALPERSGGLLAALAPKKTVWDELFISESHRLEIDQQLLAAPPAGGDLQPLPPPMPWYDPEPPTEQLKGVAVEPIAAHVPAEAFYLRFGSFANYLWFRDLNRKWQGDLGNMIFRRPIDRAGTERLEQQLSLTESALARFLGPQVIDDVAIIGLDPYIDLGAAVGILFKAKSNPLLAQDLIRQRREALKKFPDAAESTIRIGDHDASLIATPHGEVRSYYVQDGDFHLVATSKQLIQRFLEAGRGEQPLAASAGMLRARQGLPVDQPEAVFAYASPEFFRRLTSPATWIEGQRRVRSAREIKVLELARLQATAEGVAASTPQELVAAGLLPADFGTRPDGSALIAQPAGPADSLRGRPGFFLPAPEVEVTAVSPAEARAYRAFAERFRQEIGQTPPVAVAVRRTPLASGGGDTLTLDVLAAPLADVKLGRLPDILGQPSSQRVAPVAGDVIHFELVLNSPLPLAAVEPHHLFLGVRDFRTPLVVERGELAPGARPAELVRMYVGAWPKPGLMRLFLGEQLAAGAEPVPGPQETWQAKRDDFLLISFKPQVVREVLPQLAKVDAETPAQAWLEVADLTGAELAGAVNAFGYMRSREASVSVCRLMNALAEQLHVAPEGCREVAQQLMDGEFVCPLGGQYELQETPDGRRMWTSTAIEPQNRFLLTEAPEGFHLAALTWFRGLRGELRLEKDQLTSHVEIDMADAATR